MRDVQAGLTEWLRTEFTAEQNAGFPRLKCVPDTNVVRFLDHFDSLDRVGQAELVTILVDWSSHHLLGTMPNPCYEQFSRAKAFPGRAGGLRYTGVNLLAGLAKSTGGEALSGFFESQGVTGLAMEPPAELVRDSADLVPVSIPYLRRLVHTTLADLFARQTTDIGSEMWRYEGQLEGVEVKLDIQFSGRMSRPQLSYNAAVQGMGRSFVSPNLCFESTLGVGFGRWDYITKENAVRSVALLAELIGWLAKLPERLPPGCGRANHDSPR